jgi:hypothetical protein
LFAQGISDPTKQMHYNFRADWDNRL